MSANLKNVVENTKSGYIYKTTVNGVATADMGLDQLFPGSQVNGGILIAMALAVIVYVIFSKTTLGYQLKACGANRYAARYAGIKDKRNIVLSMAIAGCSGWRGWTRCTTSAAIRSFSGPPTKPCRWKVSMAFPWRSWRRTIPLG